MIDFREIERTADVDAARGLTITAVEPLFLSHTYSPEERQTWSGGELNGVTVGLVRIRTVDGPYGLGETYAGTFVPEVVRALVDYFSGYLVGRDASKIGELVRDVYSRSLFWGRFGVSVAVLSAIDSALWDLCGKALGKPVVALLGGAVHDSLPCYASGGMDTNTMRLVEEQSSYVDRGFRATKIRAGVGPDEDFAKAAAVRELVGPDVGLAVDAVQGSNPNPWDAERAIEVGRRLEPLDLLWYEEPCSALEPEDYRRCREALDMPIAGGETSTTVHDLNRLLEKDALDIAQPDAAFIGGVLEMRKACHLAEQTDVSIAVHAWCGAGTVMSNYHAAFASPNAAWLEYPTHNPFVTELMAQPLVIEQGRVQAPTAPGLGIDVDDELIARYPYQPGQHYRFKDRREASASIGASDSK